MMCYGAHGMKRDNRWVILMLVQCVLLRTPAFASNVFFPFRVCVCACVCAFEIWKCIVCFTISVYLMSSERQRSKTWARKRNKSWQENKNARYDDTNIKINRIIRRQRVKHRILWGNRNISDIAQWNCTRCSLGCASKYSDPNRKG